MLSDELLEDKSDNAPREIVKGCCGGNRGCSSEEQRRHEVFDRRPGPFAGGEVEDDWGDCTYSEEIEEARIDLTWGEDSLWANETHIKEAEAVSLLNYCCSEG